MDEERETMLTDEKDQRPLVLRKRPQKHTFNIKHFCLDILVGFLEFIK